MAGQGLSLQPEFKTTSGPSAASGLTQQEDIADLAGLSATGRTPASMTLRTKSLRACTCSMSACFSCLYFSQAAPNSWRSLSSTDFKLHQKPRSCFYPPC